MSWLEDALATVPYRPPYYHMTGACGITEAHSDEDHEEEARDKDMCSTGKHELTLDGAAWCDCFRGRADPE